MKWTIGRKLGISFTAVILLIVVTNVITIIMMTRTRKIGNRISELRTPTAQNSLILLNGINESLAGLRGWLLLNDEMFKDVRAKAWTESIDPAYNALSELSVNWTNPENVKRLENIGLKLEKFRQFQKEIEDIANSATNIPALDMLLTKAIPRAEIVSSRITEIIDLELLRDASEERKKALGIMADVRETFGQCLANISAYLL